MTQYSRIALALLSAGALFQANAYAKVEVAAQHEQRIVAAADKVEPASWNQGGTADNGDGIARASDAVRGARNDKADPAPVQEGTSYLLLLGAAGALLVLGQRRRNSTPWRTIKVEHKD